MYKFFLIFAIIAFLYIFAVVMAFLVNRRNKLKGYEGIPDLECFSPLKHISFLMGFTFSLIPKYIVDQYVLRLSHPTCRNCYKTGTCPKIEIGARACGCDPYMKAMSPFEKCSNFYWGTIIFNKKKATELVDFVFSNREKGKFT